jgi:putative hydrolase of the HAD superfamily
MDGVEAGRVLFIDDNEGHVERARSRGLHAILYTTRERFMKDFAVFFPHITRPDRW